MADATALKFFMGSGNFNDLLSAEVQAFFQDIVDGVYFTKALALHALSMLVAADPLGTILQEVLSCGVIVTLARDLGASVPAALGGPGTIWDRFLVTGTPRDLTFSPNGWVFALIPNKNKIYVNDN